MLATDWTGNQSGGYVSRILRRQPRPDFSCQGPQSQIEDLCNLGSQLRLPSFRFSHLSFHVAHTANCASGGKFISGDGSMANDTDRNQQQGQQKNTGNTSGQSNQTGQNKWQDNKQNQNQDMNRKNPSQGIDPQDRNREGSDDIEKRRAS